MRKLMVGWMVVGALALAAPAMAQVPGALDPLGLITTAAVIPFVGSGSAPGVASFLELDAPVNGVAVHMFFFDASCVRTGDSAQVGLTENDVEILRVDNLGNTPTSGLITLASPDSTGFHLVPLTAPIHARVFWIDTANDFVRLLEPIALSTVDNDFQNGIDNFNVFANGQPAFGTWSPMRTSAVFFAPLEGVNTVHTTIYFVCPNTNIQNHLAGGSALPDGKLDPTNSFVVPQTGDVAVFPTIFPHLLQVAGTTTPLIARVYDDEENFLRDVRTDCNCLSAHKVTDLSPVYADANAAPFGTYTEIEGAVVPKTNGTPAVCSLTSTDLLVTPGTPNPGNSCPLNLDPNTLDAGGNATLQFQQTAKAVPGTPERAFSFTGYRAITTAIADVFGRLSNGSRCSIANTGGNGDPFNCTPFDGR
jgi:hypothetical protein